MSFSLRQLLDQAAARLAPVSPTARLDAELLLAYSLGQPRSHLHARPDAVADESQRQDFDTLLARRAAGEPIAYLTGRRDFWSLDLAVTPATLIPRPETELLVETALTRLPPGAARVLDLGTGSGAIALALAQERPACHFTATDASPAALAVARSNAGRLGLRVRFMPGDWYAAVGDETFDLIVSNPPYIPDADPHLTTGDVRFEPRTALAAGADGLADLRQIVAGAPGHLTPGGWLLVEHGYDQGYKVRELFATADLQQISSHNDLAGHERVTCGCRA